MNIIYLFDQKLRFTDQIYCDSLLFAGKKYYLGDKK